MIRRAFRYRLYPTAEQAERLAQFAGATRFVYNLALEQRRTFGRRGRTFNFVNQGREVTELRHEVDWIGAVPSAALTQALRDLDRAFAAFFSRRARYPTPRKRRINDSFRVQAKDAPLKHINDRWASVLVPRLGWVRLRRTRDWCGRITSITFSRDALGWHASLTSEIEHEAESSVLPAVGIDRGIANTIALSTGEMLSTPAVAHIERQKRQAQRVLARRKRGSNRYKKQRRRVAALAAKMARVRGHWQHEVTTSIARRFGKVAIEKLNTSAMMRGNRGIARAIAEQSWHGIEIKLSYKLEERGGSLVKIHPAYTSQECPSCGVIDKRNRESQASFVCRACDFSGHADIVAATNILRRSTPRVEGTGYRSGEALTHGLAA